MFGFHEGSKIDKVPGANDIGAALYTPEAINEDKEREEAMIQETLTRSEWEEQMRDQSEMKRSEEINKSEKIIVEDDDDPEKNKPGYELWGRFAQYKKPVRKSRKKIKK